MSKELYLYSPIYDFVAQGLIADIEANMGEDITLRQNTPGGSVFATYGLCAKMTEHGNVTIKVDGASMSSGCNMLVYAKDVTCLDVSQFMVHRADMYVETPEDQTFLDNINKDLKAKMLLKVDAVKFKEVTGFTIDEMFNSKERIDISLSAKQAKEIGLVSKITKLTPNEVTAFNNKMFSVAATKEVTPITPIKMDLTKLKAEHPALFAEVFALGVAQEKDRVEACMEFNELDPKGVKEAIASGTPLTQKQMAAFALKAHSNKALADIAKDAAPAAVTTEATVEATAKEKELAEFDKAVNARLGIK